MNGRPRRHAPLAGLSRRTLSLWPLLACLALLGADEPPNPSQAAWPKPPEMDLDLQAMIDEARDGSTVEIPFGEFRLAQGLTIANRRNLTLTSRPGARILVADTNADVLAISDCDNILVQNLFLRHIKPMEDYECHGAVVRIVNSVNARIVNCELNGCGAIGVSANQAQGVLVRNCFVHSNTFNAFYFESCGAVEIQSCVVEDNANFIQMYRTDSLEMRDNLIRRNGGYWAELDPNPGLKLESVKLESD